MSGKLDILTDTLHEDTYALVTHLDYNLMNPNKIILQINHIYFQYS